MPKLDSQQIVTLVKAQVLRNNRFYLFILKNKTNSMMIKDKNNLFFMNNKVFYFNKISNKILKLTTKSAAK